MKKLVIGAFALSLIAAPAMAAPGFGHNDNNRGHMNNNNGHMNNNHNMTHHNWRKGQRLSSQWQHGHDVDWRSHHLRQPPRGYHWVQTDGDYVLAAVATGVILSTIFANQ